MPSSIRPSLLAMLPPEEIESAHGAAADFLEGLAEAGRSQEMGLSRLDVLLEARGHYMACLLYTSPSTRDRTRFRMPSSA